MKLLSFHSLLCAISAYAKHFVMQCNAKQIERNRRIMRERAWTNTRKNPILRAIVRELSRVKTRGELFRVGTVDVSKNKHIRRGHKAVFKSEKIELIGYRGGGTIVIPPKSDDQLRRLMILIGS